MDSSDFFGLIKNRSSVREYGSTPLSDEAIRFRLSCACTAPSAGNLESWDTVIINDKEVQTALAEAAHDRNYVAQAAVVFAVYTNYICSMSRCGERGIIYAIEDATIACTYMMLAAHVRNIRTCWTRGIR